jgi:hypothetical protein
MELNSMSENPALPKGPETDSREPALQTDFGAIVQESKEKIEGAGKRDPAVKRGRGRPKGTTKRPSVEGAAGSASPGLAPTDTNTGAGAAPPDVSKILVPSIKAISKIPAVKFQIADLAFTDEEAISCAESLNAILEAFVPDVEKMSPKTAAVITAGVTFGSIGFAKFQIYSNEMERRRGKNIQAQRTEVENTSKPTEEIQVVPAENYFKR